MQHKIAAGTVHLSPGCDFLLWESLPAPEEVSKPHAGDIKMGTLPGFAPALLLLLSTAASVDIDTSDEGYKDLRVSIGDNVPPDESITDNIKAAFGALDVQRRQRWHPTSPALSDLNCAI
ncbi:uncharacterized protein LOC144100524 [Amblyomma americanum]